MSGDFDSEKCYPVAGEECSGLGAAERELRKRFQKRFFADAVELDHAAALFELVPESQLFVKDRDSRFVYASSSFVEDLGLEDPLELVSTGDGDHFPPAIAEGFVRDDRRVLETGRPIEEKLEIRYRPTAGLAWFLTTKHPVVGSSGTIIGLVGITRSRLESGDPERMVAPPTGDERLFRAIEFISDHPCRTPTNGDIAEAADLSERQLNRLFHEAFQMTPRQFSSIVRLYLASRRLTESDDPIVEIALECGFSDQSSFTSNFRKFTGLTPRRFRKRWQGTDRRRPER